MLNHVRAYSLKKYNSGIGHLHICSPTTWNINYRFSGEKK